MRCATVRASASIKREKAMEPNSEMRQELREIFRSRVGQSFAKARDCLGYARAARTQGDHQLPDITIMSSIVIESS